MPGTRDFSRAVTIRAPCWRATKDSTHLIGHHSAAPPQKYFLSQPGGRGGCSLGKMGHFWLQCRHCRCRCRCRRFVDTWASSSPPWVWMKTRKWEGRASYAMKGRPAADYGGCITGLGRPRRGQHMSAFPHGTCENFARGHGQQTACGWMRDNSAGICGNTKRKNETATAISNDHLQLRRFRALIPPRCFTISSLPRLDLAAAVVHILASQLARRSSPTRLGRP